MNHLAFRVPQITSGKTQTISIEKILTIYRRLSMARKEQDFLVQVLALCLDEETKLFFLNLFPAGKQATVNTGLKEGRLSPANARHIFEQLFSILGRGAGSRLAGVPLVTLHDDFNGVRANFHPEFERTYEGQTTLNGELYTDSAKMSGWHFQIGLPYSKNMTVATQIISQNVSAFAAVVARHQSEWGSNDIDDITKWVVKNFDQLLEESLTEEVCGRPLLQMDYFLLPPSGIRKQILERGIFGDKEKSLLEIALLQGQYSIATFDISGGAGGVGLSELMSQQWLGEKSQHFDFYTQTLLQAFQREKGQLPNRIILVPRKADLTILTIEYMPLKERFEKMGFPTFIVPMEELQTFSTTLQTLEGDVIDLNDGERTMVVKRFTYLKEGEDGHRGLVLPATVFNENCVIVPAPISRLSASDKTVNLKLLRTLKQPLNENGVTIIPSLTCACNEDAIPGISKFLVECSRKWPEATHLGGVLKTPDKTPGRAGVGELVSAYPIPAAPFTEDTIRVFVLPLIQKLAQYGVEEIVIMPNVLPLLPFDAGKLEIKMMSFYHEPE